MSVHRADAHELFNQAAQRLEHVLALARMAFPREYELTIQPLFQQVHGALRTLPEDSEAAIVSIRTAVSSLRDLDALLEAYSLCAARR